MGGVKEGKALNLIYDGLVAIKECRVFRPLKYFRAIYYVVKPFFMLKYKAANVGRPFVNITLNNLHPLIAI